LWELDPYRDDLYKLEIFIVVGILLPVLNYLSGYVSFYESLGCFGFAVVMTFHDVNDVNFLSEEPITLSQNLHPGIIGI